MAELTPSKIGSNKITISFDVELSDPVKAMHYATNKARDALIAAYTEQVKSAISGTLFAQPPTGQKESNYTIKVNTGEGVTKYVAGMGVTVEDGQFSLGKLSLGESLDKNQSGLDDMSATIAAYDARLTDPRTRSQGVSSAIIVNAQKVEADMKAFNESLAETIKGELRANILEMMKPGGLLWRLAK